MIFSFFGIAIKIHFYIFSQFLNVQFQRNFRHFPLYYFIFSMASRRPRKTDRGIMDYDALLNAIKAHIIEKKSKKSTANQFNISMRSFGRYLDKFKAEVPDITLVSDDDLLKVVRRIASYTTPKLVSYFVITHFDML